MSESLIANLNAIKSLKVRLKVLNGCHSAQGAALREPSYANRLAQVQKLREESSIRIRALEEELQIREDLAKLQKRTGLHVEIADQTRLLFHRLKSFPLFYGSFQKISDPCFTCGMTLSKLRNPYYGIKKDVKGKKQRRKERFKLIKAARANAAKFPAGEARQSILKTADEFARYMDAAEKAVLSRDVYHYTDDKINAEGAPVGYLRGSENPEILEKYGISRSMLVPAKSKFRAELYSPDPEIFGADAKPVLVFKGTDPSCPDDCEADLHQAAGHESDYYKRGVDLANLLNQNTGGKFEIAGHSLGACIGSAGGVVTGCVTTVYNPAGLHPNTVLQYNKNVTTDASQISAFVVEGEVVNSGQDSANLLGKRMTALVKNSPLPSFDPALIVTRLLAQLHSIPTQVGRRTTLPSQIGLKTPNIVTRHLMDTVISSIEQEKRKYQQTLKRFLLPVRAVTNETENVG
jgi:hypothetical protein